MFVGGFSNDDGDGNEDVKKAVGLDWQNSNFARASCFFVHFFTVLTRLRRGFFKVLNRRATEFDTRAKK